MLSHSLCGSNQDAGSEQRRHATCTWPLSWGVPRPGPCAGLARTAVTDFPFTDSPWQVLTALSPAHHACPRDIFFQEAATWREVYSAAVEARSPWAGYCICHLAFWSHTLLAWAYGKYPCSTCASKDPGIPPVLSAPQLSGTPCPSHKSTKVRGQSWAPGEWNAKSRL